MSRQVLHIAAPTTGTHRPIRPTNPRNPHLSGNLVREHTHSRMIGAPGTHDPFGLPLLESFEAAGTVLGNVESDDDVVGHRPPLPRHLRAIDALEANESDWRNGNGAGAGVRVELRYPLSAPVARLVLDHVVAVELLCRVADSNPELGRPLPALVGLREDGLARRCDGH